ncbi:MAG: VanW family protein [Anaerolineales bacterium]|jgi:vancomycin resistance protein YoaR
MNSVDAFPKQPSKFLTWTTRVLAALFTSVVVLLSGIFLFILAARALNIQKALPGVSVQGMPVGGMNAEQIAEQVHLMYPYPEQGSIVLTDGDRAWMLEPRQLGVEVDAQEMAAQSLSIGRRGSFFNRIEEQLEAWYFGHPIAPVVRFDQVVGAYFLGGIATEIDRPTIEAMISVSGTEVTATPGQIGRSVNIDATLAEIAQPVAVMHDAVIPLVIEETSPVVLDSSATAQRARELLTQPLVFTAEDYEGLELTPETAGELMRFEIDDQAGSYRILLEREALLQLLEPLAPELERSPQNARFIFNDDTRELDLLEPAVIGRMMDVDASIEAVQTRVNQAEHNIALAFEFEDPQVKSDATAEQLDISEAVSVVSTYFYGSSAGRIQNIETASSAFHGLLVAPGATLSMADVLGDISLDNGYAEALIIYGDRTIKGVGGGVCQVSTTLFRAAFFGGYELVERHPHAYRVGYYEQGPGSPGPGLDATVFVPLVDFKFRNDTNSWLLLETYVYGNQLLWKFYSTSDGRSVEWSRRVSDEVEAPKPLYKENSDLDKGEIEQIDYEADGMDVVVYRTVTRSGEVLHQDTIKTHYLPWRAIYEFGPGTDIPDDVEVEDS